MSNAASTDTDPWDRQLDAVSARHKAVALSSAIPDDWDQATSSGEEDNQTIWENANKKAPMPQLVATSPRAGTGSSVVPPASAFQPPIRILKRSAAQTGKYASDDSPASANISGTGTFAERSARYNAARERIFADTAEANGGRGEGGPIPAIIRNPKGPEDAQGTDGQGKEGSRGFGTRARVRGSSNNRPNDNQDRQFQDSDLGTK